MHICPEHMCIIFDDLRIIERTAPGGDLELEVIELKQKKNPTVDFLGNTIVANEMCLIRDRSFDPADPRHKVAKPHRHITAAGGAGASGKYDPKTITAGGIKYLLLAPPFSACELCESGQMIPPNKRFRDSKYRPGIQ
jgi:hypothetical protein